MPIEIKIYLYIPCQSNVRCHAARPSNHGWAGRRLRPLGTTSCGPSRYRTTSSTAKTDRIAPGRRGRSSQGNRAASPQSSRGWTHKQQQQPPQQQNAGSSTVQQQKYIHSCRQQKFGRFNNRRSSGVSIAEEVQKFNNRNETWGAQTGNRLRRISWTFLQSGFCERVCASKSVGAFSKKSQHNVERVIRQRQGQKKDKGTSQSQSQAELR